MDTLDTTSELGKWSFDSTIGGYVLTPVPPPVPSSTQIQAYLEKLYRGAFINAPITLKDAPDFGLDETIVVTLVEDML